MPDYRYIKKQVEEMKNEKEKEREEASRRYYEGEPEAVNEFVEFVKKQIEQAVLDYYQYGKNPYISKKVLSREYVYFKPGNQKNEAFCAGIVEVFSFFEHFPEINYVPDEKSKYRIFFPSEECLHSFEGAANKILNKEDVIVSFHDTYGQMSSPVCFKIYFINIRAELGKL